MGRQSDKSRDALLNAAEELFAQHGIDAVSNRKIAEHAGTANHSAVKYHFGGRDDLLRALIQRAMDQMVEHRDRLTATEDMAGGLREIVTRRTLPWIYVFAAQGTSGWRAQFLFQARLHPDLPTIVGDSLRADVLSKDLRSRTRKELSGIPQTVLRARSAILGEMMLGSCAKYEQQVNSGNEQGNWESMGYFLIDAIVGMLAAPSTAPSDFLGLDW